MSGIKLTLDDAGEPEIWQPEEPNKPRCIIDDCEHILPGWKCGYDNTSIWDHWYSPGWCPLFKWYRASKAKEFYKHEL